MSKYLANCKQCDIEFECTDENKGEHKLKSTITEGVMTMPDGDPFTCPNGHEEIYTYEERRFLPLTIDEAIDLVKHLDQGKSHKYQIGEVGHKTGDYKKCKKCGKLTDVVTYNTCMGYWKNCSTQCPVCDKSEEAERWWEPCKENDDCAFHKNMDSEKIGKEHDQFTARHKVLQTIFEVCPPLNDGILELDRIAFMFGLLKDPDDIDVGSTNNTRSYVFSEFMEYCAEQGILQGGRGD